MKKIITSILIILLSIVCLANYSYATGEQLEATIEITPNTDKVVAGDNVVFTFITKNIVNAESGKIFAIGGKITYDKEFFESVTASGITISEETGLFNSTTAVSEGESNGTITLKVKSNATGSGNVEFSELIAGDGRLENMETLGASRTENQSFTVTIDTPTADDGDGEEEPPVDNGDRGEEPPVDNGDRGEEPPVDDGDGEEEPPVDDGDGEEEPPVDDGDEEEPPVGTGDENKNQETTDGMTVVVGNDPKDNTTANKEIPKAGLNTILVATLVIVAILSIVMYTKNKKYQDIR